MRPFGVGRQGVFSGGERLAGALPRVPSGLVHSPRGDRGSAPAKASPLNTISTKCWRHPCLAHCYPNPPR